MKTKKIAGTYLLVAFLLTAHFSKAQYVAFLNGKVEAGLNFGPANFLGDLGGNRGEGKTFLKDNNIELTKAFTGGYISYYPKEWLGLRATFTHTRVEGDDAVIKDEGGAENARRWRNLNFKSNINEINAMVELSPTVLLEEYPDYLPGKFRPTILAGIGYFSYNPQTYYKGNWVDLRPLHTEGQGFSQYPDRKEYGKTAISIPVGIGFKYFLTEKFVVGFEAIHRFTNTDYIDDVSTRYINPIHFNTNLPAAQAQLATELHNRNIVPTNVSFSAPGAIRGDPTEKDGFYTMQIKFGWRLGGEADRYSRQARRQMKCYY
jgi:hypothetical protein